MIYIQAEHTKQTFLSYFSELTDNTGELPVVSQNRYESYVQIIYRDINFLKRSFNINYL